MLAFWVEGLKTVEGLLTCSFIMSPPSSVTCVCMGYVWGELFLKDNQLHFNSTGEGLDYVYEIEFTSWGDQHLPDGPLCLLDCLPKAVAACRRYSVGRARLGWMVAARCRDLPAANRACPVPWRADEMVLFRRRAWLASQRACPILCSIAALLTAQA